MSNPFDRLDQLRDDFTEDFFMSTDDTAKTLIHGPLGELANGTEVDFGEPVF